MATVRRKKAIPPELDPILPLPAGSGIPALREGDGKMFLDDDRPVVLSMTRRAAHILWEQAEAMAKRSYQGHIEGPFKNHAEAILEACYAFRNQHHEEIYEVSLKAMSEERARKARSIRSELEKQAAAAKRRPKAQSSQNDRKTGSPAASKAPKKVRCTAWKDLRQCKGPLDHKGMHKNASGDRWL